MSTIEQPLATLVSLLTRLLAWLAAIRPTIVTRRTLDELLDEIEDQGWRLERAVDELDAQGGRVIAISGDVTYAYSRLGRIAAMVDSPVDSEGTAPREIAREALAELDKRKAERRKAKIVQT